MLALLLHSSVKQQSPVERASLTEECQSD